MQTLYYNHHTTAEPEALFGVSADSPVHENTPWSVARHLWRRLEQSVTPEKKIKIHSKKSTPDIPYKDDIFVEKNPVIIEWLFKIFQRFYEKPRVYCQNLLYQTNIRPQRPIEVHCKNLANYSGKILYQEVSYKNHHRQNIVEISRKTAQKKEKQQQQHVLQNFPVK